MLRVTRAIAMSVCWNNSLNLLVDWVNLTAISEHTGLSWMHRNVVVLGGSNVKSCEEEETGNNASHLKGSSCDSCFGLLLGFFPLLRELNWCFQALKLRGAAGPSCWKATSKYQVICPVFPSVTVPSTGSSIISLDYKQTPCGKLKHGKQEGTRNPDIRISTSLRK